MTKHKKLALGALSAALTLAYAPVHATNGYFLPGYGFRSQGMGGVGYAYGTDSLSIAANPANIVNTGMRGDMGVGLFNAVRHAAVGKSAGQDPDHDPFGFDKGSTSNRDWFIMPEMGMTMPLTENLHAGMAFVPNGGGSTVYPTNFFNYIGLVPHDPGYGQNLGGELMQLLVPITVGYRVNEHHAFGASLDLAEQRFRMYGLHSFQTFSNTFHIPISADYAHLTNNGYDYSFGIGGKLGWLGSFFDDTLSVGLSYTSRTYMSKFEKYSGLFAQQGDFDIPANFGVGIALKPKKFLTLAADIERIDWHSINALGDRGPGTSNSPYPGPGTDNALNGIPSAAPGGAAFATGNEHGMGFGWTDQTVYKLGVNWGVNQRLQLRAGYNYAKSPIPDDQLTFNTLLPVTTNTHYTFGFTYKATDELEITGTYVRVPERSQHSPIGNTGGGNPVDTGLQNVVGSVDIGMKQQMVAVSLGWILDPGKTDYGDAAMDPLSFAGWYFGFGAGQDKGKDWSGSRFASTFASQGVTATQDNSDVMDLGIKVFSGYRFNKYLGLEGGFAQLNNFKASGTTTAPAPGTVYETDKDNAWTLAAVGTLPVTKDISVFAKLGADNWKRITNTFVPDPNHKEPNIRRQTQDRGTDPYYGVGVSYALLDNLEVRGEYERFDFGGPKIDLLSAGAAVKF